MYRSLAPELYIFPMHCYIAIGRRFPYSSEKAYLVRRSSYLGVIYSVADELTVPVVVKHDIAELLTSIYAEISDMLAAPIDQSDLEPPAYPERTTYCRMDICMD